MCSGFCALPSWSGWRCAWRSFGHYFELLSGTDQRQLEIIKLRVFVQRVAPYSDQSHPARAAPRVAMAPGSGRLHCVSWPDRARRACQRQPAHGADPAGAAPAGQPGLHAAEPAALPGGGAPPADASRPDLARLRCFAAGPGQGVNYAAGTWHHPLLALQAECDFLVVDRGGAASDHNCDEFALDGLDLWLAAALPA